MKFYKFDLEYTAVIWAANVSQANKIYELNIDYARCSIKPAPRVVDVDEVFQMMIDSDFDGDKDRMAIGQIGELYKIITSKEPLVVLHNCD